MITEKFRKTNFTLKWATGKSLRSNPKQSYFMNKNTKGFMFMNSCCFYIVATSPPTPTPACLSFLFLLFPGIAFWGYLSCYFIFILSFTLFLNSLFLFFWSTLKFYHAFLKYKDTLFWIVQGLYTFTLIISFSIYILFMACILFFQPCKLETF